MQALKQSLDAYTKSCCDASKSENIPQILLEIHQHFRAVEDAIANAKAAGMPDLFLQELTDWLQELEALWKIIENLRQATQNIQGLKAIMRGTTNKDVRKFKNNIQAAFAGYVCSRLPSESGENIIIGENNTSQLVQADLETNIQPLYEIIREENPYFSEARCKNLAQMKSWVHRIMQYWRLLKVDSKGAKIFYDFYGLGDRSCFMGLINDELTLIDRNIEKHNPEIGYEKCRQLARAEQKRYAISEYLRLLAVNPEEAKAWYFFRDLNLNDEDALDGNDGENLIIDDERDKATQGNIIIREANSPNLTTNHNYIDDNDGYAENHGAGIPSTHIERVPSQQNETNSTEAIVYQERCNRMIIDLLASMMPL